MFHTHKDFKKQSIIPVCNTQTISRMSNSKATLQTYNAAKPNESNNTPMSDYSSLDTSQMNNVGLEDTDLIDSMNIDRIVENVAKGNSQKH